ncbi:MAG: flagellar protein FliT [bacterium]|nr:flagellar protein FliT [bacterium]
MSVIELERLRVISGEQVDAAKSGNLDLLEQLEAKRKELIDSMFDDGLYEVARREPETMGVKVREILENDRLVRAALEAGKIQRQKALEKLDKQGKAERAYRGVASGSR